MNRIEALHQQGQSIWYDYIDRNLLHSGELKELVDSGVRGVTSNPSIFEQAMSSGNEYDDDLEELSGTDKSAKEIFETIAVSDIQDAADVLRPVYDEANGQDGFVSLEVSPDLAYDTQKTVEEARRLHADVNRPNLMIKVPATAQGIPAIQTLISEGININVTLIFGIERYEKVMDAYLSGLEERINNGLAIDGIASVASFFISRVDSKIDDMLDEVGTEKAAELKGKVGVANAKVAYHRFERTFEGPRWEALAAEGANVQRPLWASTSTKNPDYDELLYVESLIGPHTVNTMPPATLETFREQGEVEKTVDEDVEGAQKILDELALQGVSLVRATDELEAEGVQKFADSYDELLETISERRQEMTA